MTIALISLAGVALALAGAAMGMAIWMGNRAFGASEGEKSALKTQGETERQLEARGVAVADRDRVIEALTTERDGLKSALEHSTQALNEALTTCTKDPHAAATLLRSALDRLASLRDGVPSQPIPTKVP